MGNICEDSVGTLLPVTSPDEVLHKEECVEPSIEEAFSAIRIGSEEKMEQSDSSVDEVPEGECHNAEIGNTSDSDDDTLGLTGSANDVCDVISKYGLGDVVEEVNSQEDVVEIWGESWEDDDIYTESAKIDDDIVDIIRTLNTKGYKTVYSCSGHPSARLKSDTHRDGIKNGKLYSTARIVFAEQYQFSSIPEGWLLKELDKNRVGIYVKGLTFKATKGMPMDQFNRWKKRYMYHLEKWANTLEKRPKKNADQKDSSFDEAAEDLTSVAEDLMLDALRNPLYMV